MGDIFLTMTVILISITGHMVIAGMYNHRLTLPILYFLCFQGAPQLVVVLYLVR